MYPYIHVFGLTLPTFGLMMSLGMLCAFVLLFKTRKYIDLSEDDLLSAVILAIVCGMLGSKILYWITEVRSIIANPASFKYMILSGLVFYGSLIGGLIGLMIFCRRKRKSFLALADLFMPSLVLGQAFGRIGCFHAGCCYGKETSGWLSVTFPEGCVAPAGVPLVPTQLLESAFLFILTVVLVWMLSKKLKSGTVLGWYLILYGVWRFIIEFYRNDERGAVGALSTSQFIAIFAVLIGIVLLILIRKGVIVSRETSDAAPENDEVETETVSESGASDTGVKEESESESNKS